MEKLGGHLVLSFILVLYFFQICRGVSSPEQVGTYDSDVYSKDKTHVNLRRLDCQLFCRKTGFSGYVGGCHCGK